MSEPFEPRGYRCCFVPPHVLESLVTNQASLQLPERARLVTNALDSASVSSSFKSLRIARSEAVARVARTRIRVRHHAPGNPRRRIFDCGTKSKLPGALVRQEGQAKSDDAAVNDAYDHLGTTYEFYWHLFHRDSLDDRGLPLIAAVHFSHDYDDAFWDGDQMIFGDGDQRIFQSFAPPLDVTAHELTHGVTQYEANLVYWRQSGALNESISDVFAILTKQKSLNQRAEDSNWLLGEKLFTPRIVGVAVRSMKAPGTAYNDPILGKDPQPPDMDGYVDTLKDHGGVHINSGIPNRAFYLAATKIGGYAWTRAGLIWYRTLTSRQLSRNAQFADFAHLTVRVAGRIFGPNSLERHAVRDAWAEVRVLPFPKRSRG
jgi:Zn-dependent metalloprotease